MVFDYIDGAAGEGQGEALNRAALRDLRLQPRILVNVTKRDLSVDIFDHQAICPFGITPMGMCNLSAPGADLMHGADRRAMHPGWSFATLINGRPELANFVGSGNSFDRTESRASADWDSLRQFRDLWHGKLVVKGVLSVEDAIRLKQAGVDAAQVSSHGGRQLDSAPPPILMLRRIRDAVGADFPLFYDSGLRSGEDVVKAYAMGADFVFFGRAMQFAIAAGGETGLSQLWDVLLEEASLTLAQLGRTSMQSLSETVDSH